MNLVSIKNKRDILLIILNIIVYAAILNLIYTVNVKPYISEISKRNKDTSRIENLSLLNSATNKLLNTKQNIFKGEQNKIYISIPSYNTNCNDLNLPSLSDGFEYQCKTKTDYRKTDGQGWLPINFTKLPDNEFGLSLPIDPINTADNGYYYSYTIGEGNDFILTSLLESDKYLEKTASKDGGTDPARLEVGSNLQLWTKASGLVGYWNFNEGKGEIIKDASRYGNDGVFKGVGKPNWIKGIRDTAIDFDGNSNYVSIGNKTNLQLRKPYSISVWVKANSFLSNSTIIALFNNYSNYILIGVESSGKWNFLTVISSVGAQIKSDAPAQTDIWIHIIGMVDSSGNMNLYINGVKQTETTTTDDLIGTETTYIGWQGYPDSNFYFDGLIDEVHIYNRELGEPEIRIIYNATK